MPARLSSSDEDVDNRDQPHLSPNSPHAHDTYTISSSKYDVKRKSDTLDRRKVERSIGLEPTSPNGPGSGSGRAREGTPNLPILSSDQDDIKMNDARTWRLSRARGPWSCSALTLALTALGTVLLLTILQAFFTRQVDPNGCIVPWTRPTYIAFKDFDTEHTRFATKYHLYLLRDGSYDEDPKVGVQRNWSSMIR